MTDIQTYLQGILRDVPDFPQPGILFKDIAPVLQSPEALRRVIDHLTEHYRDQKIDRIVGIESRGFIFGTPLAYTLGTGIALVRKPGKLPWKTASVDYALEYGAGTLQIHTDAVEPGQRVLIVDDLLATGGTAGAAIQLVQQLGAEVVGCAFIIELDFLEGRKRLGDVDVHSLVHC